MRIVRTVPLSLAMTISVSASAQDASADPGETLPRASATAEEALAAAEEAYGPPPPTEACAEVEDAAAISGTIIVCRRLVDQGKFRTASPSDARKRYAEKTKFEGDPQAPNVDGPGIFHGPATVGGMCIPGLQRCPPPPAMIVDFEALPEAPPGSDADRIARGLPPLGKDNPVGDAPAAEINDSDGEAEAGNPSEALPSETPVSPEESASPTAER